MTIKNYHAAFAAAMKELEEISSDELLERLRSYNNGPLGEAFGSSARSVSAFNLPIDQRIENRINHFWTDDQLVAIENDGTIGDVEAANDDNYALAA